jgi:acetamidase/formamidase
MSIHEIPLEKRTVHGYFSRELAPVLAIDPGDAVRFQSLNAGWRWEPDAELFERDAALHGGHALNGPIEVRGARAGQTLVVTIDEVTPRGWGINFGDGAAYEWRLDDGVWRQDELRVVPAPFLGVIGMPPPEPGDHSTTPLRRQHRLQAARRRHDALSADPGRRRAHLGGRRPRRAGRRRGVGDGDRVPARARPADDRRAR